MRELKKIISAETRRQSDSHKFEAKTEKESNNARNTF